MLEHRKRICCKQKPYKILALHLYYNAFYGWRQGLGKVLLFSMPRPKKEQPNHSGGLYEVKITIGKTVEGKLIRKSFYSSTSKADARRQADEWKIQQEVANHTGISEAIKSKNFGQWAASWLQSIKGTVKDNTYNLTYLNSVNNHLIPYFGKMNLSDIKQIDIQIFFNKKSSTLSHETQKKLRMCLSSIFESAVDNELIYRNPCRNIKLVGKKSGEKNIYTQHQVNMIMDYAKTHRYGLEIIMLLTYGLRRGELLGIRWEDVDLENKVLHIRHAVTDVQDPETRKMKIVVDDPKTAFSVRDLPLTDEIAAMIINKSKVIVVGKNEHKKKPGHEVQTEFVFHNRMGKVFSPRTWSRRHYDVFMSEMHKHFISQDPPVDIPILNPHELRHTRTSLWVNEDKNLYAVAVALGWNDLKMLRERYAHPNIESSRKALDL